MTKSNGEEARLGGRMERFQQGVRKRTLLAKKKVQNITKEDVKSYLFRNAFVLLTVTAVIVGKSFDNKTPFQKKKKKTTGSCFSGASDCLGKLSDELIVGIQKDRPGFPLNWKILFFSPFHDSLLARLEL